MRRDWTSPRAFGLPFWELNLAALKLSQPSLAAKVSACQEPDMIRVRMIREGIFELQRRFEDGREEIYDAQICHYQFTQVSQQIQAAVSQGSELIVLFGAGSGAFFPKLSPLLSKYTNWQLFIVARDWIEISILAHLYPLVDAIRDRRLYFCVNNRKSIQQTISRFGFGNRAGIRLLSGLPQENTALKDSLKATLNDDRLEQNRLAERAIQFYQDNPPNKCGKVLFIDPWENYPGSWMIDGIAQAFALQGLTVRRLNLPTSVKPFNSVFRKEDHTQVLQALNSFHPDLIFTMQYELSYYLPPEVCQDLRCPNAFYGVDYINCHAGPGRERRLYIACTSEKRAAFLSTYPLTAFLPFATAISVIRELPRPEYQCPVSFLGSGGAPKAQRAQWEKTLREKKLLDSAQETISQLLAGTNFDELCQRETISSLPQKLLDLFKMYCISEGQRKRRMAFLTPLLPYGLRLYGSSFRQASDNPKIHQATYDNVASSRRFSLYVSSAININIHAADRHDSPNVRFFEIPAAPGFMLTDYRKAYTNFLTEEETSYFTTAEELTEKVDYFLCYPEEREPYIERGFRRVQSALTWDHWRRRF